MAAELKLSEGDHEGARPWLDRLEQLSGLGLGDAAHAALLRARIAAAEGRDEAAATALAGAAGLVSTRQGASSSLEVRAGLALHARRLREEDLRRAHRRAEVSDVVDTAERWRASSLRLPLSVGAHPEVAGPFEDLRRPPPRPRLWLRHLRLLRRLLPPHLALLRVRLLQKLVSLLKASLALAKMAA